MMFSSTKNIPNIDITPKKKVIVGISGGVDSSVAAYLLKKQGYHVYGLFMKNWEEDDDADYCHAAVDLSDAQSICNKLNIELLTINFSAEYWDNVFEHFLSEYQAGRTPNPDILCNKEIKFKSFLDYSIKDLGADYIATGHYARCNQTNEKMQLLRGIDHQKDQSYFLYTLNETQLKKSLFPIGELKKSEVRQIATDLNLTTAQKKDSTGICFIGKRKFRDFLARYLPAQPGKIRTTDGHIIGDHQGLMYYTLGQRKGLGIGGQKSRTDAPWYVVGKELKSNELIIAQGHNHPALFSNGLIANQLHWVNRKPLIQKMRCTVRTRYRQQDVPCTLLPLNNEQVKVYFHTPICAVTPGQSAVFYHHEVCLGGGVIEQTI